MLLALQKRLRKWCRLHISGNTSRIFSQALHPQELRCSTQRLGFPATSCWRVLAVDACSCALHSHSTFFSAVLEYRYTLADIPNFGVVFKGISSKFRRTDWDMGERGQRKKGRQQRLNNFEVTSILTDKTKLDKIPHFLQLWEILILLEALQISFYKAALCTIFLCFELRLTQYDP